MIEINVRAWSDIIKCYEYIVEMIKEGFKIRIINVTNEFLFVFEDDLIKLGLFKVIK